MNTTSQNTPPFRISNLLNIFALFGISASLIIAFYYQLEMDEIPCPLCLLQRVGMIIIGIGFLMNVRFGIRTEHYGLVLLSSLLTGAIATRQTLLHILPGNPGYGSTLFNFHFYTLAVASSLAVIVFVAVLLMFKIHPLTSISKLRVNFLGRTAIVIFIAVIAANLISTVLECRGGQCDDNPTFYQLLKKYK